MLQKQAQDAARAEGQALVRQSTIALTEAERDSLLAQSEEKFAQARGEQPPTPTPASAPPPQDYLAAAEAAVAKAMAANA